MVVVWAKPNSVSVLLSPRPTICLDWLSDFPLFSKNGLEIYYCIGASICTHQEIECLLDAGFFTLLLVFFFHPVIYFLVSLYHLYSGFTVPFILLFNNVIN